MEFLGSRPAVAGQSGTPRFPPIFSRFWLNDFSGMKYGLKISPRRWYLDRGRVKLEH